MKRVIIPFLLKQSLLLGAFYLTLNLFDGREDIVIKIVGNKTGSDELILDPPEIPNNPRDTYAGKKVIWQLSKSASNIRKFWIEGKETSKNVFRCDPPQGNKKKNAEGKLKNSWGEAVFEYTIWWMDDKKMMHEYDPKIRVKPGLLPFQVLISIVYALLVGLISFQTFKKKQS